MKFVYGNFKKKLNKQETLNILNKYQEKFSDIKNYSGFCILPEYFFDANLLFKDNLCLVQQNESLINLKKLNKLATENKAKFYLLGHSDYRSSEKENNSICAKKAKTALNKGAKVIFCVGESLQTKNAGETLSFIYKQIAPLRKMDISNLIIAYEPIYSIGTGEVAKKEDVAIVINYIKTVLKNALVLYGGSVNAANAQDILSWDFCDGVLVGGESLNFDKFSQILNLIK